MADVAGRQRDIFPLPLISAPLADRCMQYSRSARKKRSQKAHDVGRTNEAIAALNNLYGCVVPDVPAVPIALQLAAQEHIFKSVTVCVEPEAVQQKSPEEPYSALFGSSALYGFGGPLRSHCQLMLRVRLL